MIHDIAKTPDDKLRIKIDEMRNASKQQSLQLRSRWIDSLRDYRPQSSSGNQRDGVGNNKLQKKRRSNELVENGSGNRIASIIDQQISMIYENNPRAYFLPKETSDLEFARNLESLTRWRMNRINIRQKLIKGGLYSKLFGWQAFHVYWDDNLADDADTNVRILWPESFLIDPKLETQNPEEGDFVGYDRMVNLKYAKRRWPKKGSKIAEEMSAPREGSPIGGSTHGSDSLARELGHITKGTSDSPMSDSEAQVELTVLWFKDYAVNIDKVKEPMSELIRQGKVIKNELLQYVWAETRLLVTPESIPDVTVKTPRYPYGRHVIKVGNTILEDYAWGYVPETGKIKRRAWPIALAVNKIIPNVWYGQDECEGLRADQNINDVCLQNIVQHAYTTAHPVREIDKTKIKQSKSDLLNQLQSGVVVSNGKNGMITHPTPSMSSDAYNLMQMVQSNMEIQGGIPAQSMGKTGSSEQTATEIAALQRASRGKVGITSSFIDELVNRLYILVAESIQFNYKENSIMRILGDSRSSQMSSIEISRGLKDIKFDVEVEAGSTLPNDKQQKKVEAQELMGHLGLAGLPNLIEAYEVKDPDAILQAHSDFMLFQQYGPLLQDPNVQKFLQDFSMQQQEQGQAQ
jgi:hypothetical protein